MKKAAKMKKIIVIGCPGSGKSTFSRKLHDKTLIPLYHLDLMFWREDKTTVPRDVFLSHLSDVLVTEEWIIDGNYSSTMELRMDACDTVIFLDYPAQVCLDGVAARRGVARADMPWVETEEDEEFTELIKSYNERQRPNVLSLFEKYKDKSIIVFTKREQSDAFLGEL